jgi:oxygen-independent coproporphyrinogen-3 oxidase
MAGIYIHIPFCTKKCNYCNFYSIASQKFINGFETVLAKEINVKRKLFENKIITSIYIGGGTPSLLSVKQLEFILKNITENFSIAPKVEITLEANPLDLTTKYLHSLKSIGFNRLSLGVQSMDDKILQYLSRNHSARNSLEAIERVQSSGFTNYTIDLIFGVPGMTDQLWKNQLQKVKAMGIPHLSAYALTVEEKTALDLFIRRNTLPKPEEETQARQFEILMDWAEQTDYEHYEISNLAIKGFRSQHNSAYWKREEYLGLGPSAHSFVGKHRCWNIANTQKYIEGIKNGNMFFDKETLSKKDIYNEQILTGIRTLEGINLKTIEPQYRAHFRTISDTLIEKELMKCEEDYFRLTKRGRLLADAISSELFL